MRSALPKVLHPLLGVPLLEHVLETLREVDPGPPVVVIGHGRDEVRKTFEGAEIHWGIQEEQKGTGHAASIGIEALMNGPLSTRGGDPASLEDVHVLVANGDLPLLRAETLLRLVDEHVRRKARVSLLTCEFEDPTGYGRIVRDPDGSFAAIVEEKDADAETREIREVNVGTYVFQIRAFLDYYAQIDTSNAQGELYLTDVAGKAAGAGETVSTSAVADPNEVAQVNSRRDLAQASVLVRQRLLDGYMDSGVTIDDPATTYIEKGVSIGLDTRILPFTVLHRGVRIGERCEVGPFTHLRAGTVLKNGASIGNFVEVKNTEVGEKSKARHLSYLGDGDVGDGVNIGAGTIFANYDGKLKHKTTVKDGASVGSGTILVAPVTIGVGATTGAGSVVLRNRDVADGDVVMGVPARSVRHRTGKPS